MRKKNHGDLFRRQAAGWIIQQDPLPTTLRTERPKPKKARKCWAHEIHTVIRARVTHFLRRFSSHCIAPSSSAPSTPCTTSCASCLSSVGLRTTGFVLSHHLAKSSFSSSSLSIPRLPSSQLPRYLTAARASSPVGTMWSAGSKNP